MPVPPLFTTLLISVLMFASRTQPLLSKVCVRFPPRPSNAVVRGRASSSSSSREDRKNVGKPKAVDRGQYKNKYVHTPNTPRSGLPASSPFTVLGIETSCDDTGVAVVSSTGEILGESLASQGAIHSPFGGIVPGLAKEAHAENIDATVRDALAKANLKPEDVDAVAVTVGPGLEVRASEEQSDELRKAQVTNGISNEWISTRPNTFFSA